MSTKMNCWDMMNCGREIDGSKVEELGVCPAATSQEFTAANSGDCGGRACWKIKEKIGKMDVPHWCDPERDCLTCDVFNMVREEEKDCFLL